MPKNMNQNNSMLFQNLQRIMDAERVLDCAILAAETKFESVSKIKSKKAAYEAMLLVADKLRVSNAFDNSDEFYQVYQQMDDHTDWERLLYDGLNTDRSRTPLVPGVLFSVMMGHIKNDTKTILIPEAEKFVPNLKTVVCSYNSCQFTLTSTNALFVRAMERMFAGYDNVTVLNASIYAYGFLNEKYDLILSVPTFGGRELAEDSKNFICRESDMVALENLLLHLTVSGRLVIVMPARIAFAGGKVGDLRKFVMQMYKLEEISQLPNGIFQNTGIKTHLLVVANGRTDDVIVRKYEAVDKKKKREPVGALKLKEDTFVMMEELEENGDWSIDKLLVQQNDELMNYQNSKIRKAVLGEVAEIFRGKSVNRKDENGAIGVVNISNIGQYEIDYDRLDKLDEEERKVMNYVLREGDVVIPARGTTIKSAVFHEQSYLCIASSNVIVIRPDMKKLNSVFLKIYIDSPIGNALIGSLQQGMTLINMSYKDLRLLEIPFPSMAEQESLAKEYEEAYQVYIKTISKAERQWAQVLTKLQCFKP